MYLRNYVDKKKTPQSAPLSKRQVRNRAGGYVHKVDGMTQLNRFLILGTCGGTYYASERKITQENLDNVRDILDANGVEAVQMAVEVSQAGRAPKNDEAIMVLAMASVHKDTKVRKVAFEALPKICRIGTHLYQFLELRKVLEGGWGRGMRDAVASWFNSRKPDNLALQVAKYKARDGWAARDALRLSHPKAPSAEHSAVYKWVVSGGELSDGAPAFLEACNEVARLTGTGKPVIQRALKLIEEHRLPREVLPTQLLKSKEIWEAMLPHMGATALMRNLGKMTNIDLLKPNSNATIAVAQKLEDPEFIRRGRVHPLNVLVAKMIYEAGHGQRGSLSWKPVAAIKSSLEDTFYNSFGVVEPTGKKTLIGLDVSGSMGGWWGSAKCGLQAVPGMMPCVITACMSMVTVRTEGAGCHVMGFSDRFVDLGITKKDSLENAIQKVTMRNFGGTDVALPPLWALKNEIEVDTFATYTDNETWAGRMHPSEALKQYRQKMGIDSKMVAVAIAATNYSVCDPKDPNSVNVAGFDLSTPHIISAFARGEA